MNHFLALLVLAVCIGTAFTLINPEGQEPLRYFLKLLLYMIVGSWVVAWLMYVLV